VITGINGQLWVTTGNFGALFTTLLGRFCQMSIGKWEKSIDKWEKSIDKWEKSIDKWEKSIDKWEKSVDKWEKSDDKIPFATYTRELKP